MKLFLVIVTVAVLLAVAVVWGSTSTPQVESKGPSVINLTCNEYTCGDEVTFDQLQEATGFTVYQPAKEN